MTHSEIIKLILALNNEEPSIFSDLLKEISLFPRICRILYELQHLKKFVQILGRTKALTDEEKSIFIQKMLEMDDSSIVQEIFYVLLQTPSLSISLKNVLEKLSPDHREQVLKHLEAHITLEITSDTHQVNRYIAKIKLNSESFTIIEPYIKHSEVYIVALVNYFFYLEKVDLLFTDLFKSLTEQQKNAFMQTLLLKMVDRKDIVRNLSNLKVLCPQENLFGYLGQYFPSFRFFYLIASEVFSYDEKINFLAQLPEGLRKYWIKEEWLKEYLNDKAPASLNDTDPDEKKAFFWYLRHLADHNLIPNMAKLLKNLSEENPKFFETLRSNLPQEIISLLLGLVQKKDFLEEKRQILSLLFSQEAQQFEKELEGISDLDKLEAYLRRCISSEDNRNDKQDLILALQLLLIHQAFLSLKVKFPSDSSSIEIKIEFLTKLFPFIQELYKDFTSKMFAKLVTSKMPKKLVAEGGGQDFTAILPSDVLNLILSYLSYKQRHLLRGVNRKLRDFKVLQPFFLPEDLHSVSSHIKFLCTHNDFFALEIIFNDIKIFYARDKNFILNYAKNIFERYKKHPRIQAFLMGLLNVHQLIATQNDFQQLQEGNSTIFPETLPISTDKELTKAIVLNPVPLTLATSTFHELVKANILNFATIYAERRRLNHFVEKDYLIAFFDLLWSKRQETETPFHLIFAYVLRFSSSQFKYVEHWLKENFKQLPFEQFADLAFCYLRDNVSFDIAGMFKKLNELLSLSGQEINEAWLKKEVLMRASNPELTLNENELKMFSFLLHQVDLKALALTEQRQILAFILKNSSIRKSLNIFLENFPDQITSIFGVFLENNELNQIENKIFLHELISQHFFTSENKKDQILSTLDEHDYFSNPSFDELDQFLAQLPKEYNFNKFRHHLLKHLQVFWHSSIQTFQGYPRLLRIYNLCERFSPDADEFKQTLTKMMEDSIHNTGEFGKSLHRLFMQDSKSSEKPLFFSQKMGGVERAVSLAKKEIEVDNLERFELIFKKKHLFSKQESQQFRTIVQEILARSDWSTVKKAKFLSAMHYISKEPMFLNLFSSLSAAEQNQLLDMQDLSLGVMEHIFSLGTLDTSAEEFRNEICRKYPLQLFSSYSHLAEGTKCELAIFIMQQNYCTDPLLNAAIAFLGETKEKFIEILKTYQEQRVEFQDWFKQLQNSEQSSTISKSFQN